MTNVKNQPRSLVQKMETDLAEIIDTRRGSIRAFVAQEALEYCDENPAQMFIDLAIGGCQSGTISSLIYYADTARFFECYYEDIEDLREEYEASIGMPLSINGDLKNWLAWFAFEETAFQIANELGLDI